MTELNINLKIQLERKSASFFRPFFAPCIFLCVLVKALDSHSKWIEMRYGLRGCNAFFSLKNKDIRFHWDKVEHTKKYCQCCLLVLLHFWLSYDDCPPFFSAMSTWQLWMPMKKFHSTDFNANDRTLIINTYRILLFIYVQFLPLQLFVRSFVYLFTFFL